MKSDRDVVSGRVARGIDGVSDQEIELSYLHNRGPVKQEVSINS